MRTLLFALWSLLLLSGLTPERLASQPEPTAPAQRPTTASVIPKRLFLPIAFGNSQPLPDPPGPAGEEGILAASPAPSGTATFTTTLVQIVATSLFTPPSPDPAGIVYLPASNQLLIADPEVNELAIFQNRNLFFATLMTGALQSSGVTLPYSREPTGVAVNPANGHLFISDDDAKKIFEVDPSADGQYGTGDDSIASFSTLAFGSSDPEDVLFGENELFIADGASAQIYHILPGDNGLFDGVDDPVSHFGTLGHGIKDPEGIAYNSDKRHLYIVGKPVTKVAELTVTGELVQILDIRPARAIKPAGLTYAPHSQKPQQRSLYLVDRGIDNDIDPNENDGRYYELGLPNPAPRNIAPIVDAGPDITITLPASAVLTGTVTDDGLPPDPLSVTWGVDLGMVGSVTLHTPNQLHTTIDFVTPGHYIMRLVADDGLLRTTDRVAITVRSSSPGSQPVGEDPPGLIFLPLIQTP